MDLNAYDHVIFFIALVIPYTFKKWKQVLWLVSIFTIGHTLSLLLSVYEIVNFNAVWIEFLIPVTIGITAVYSISIAGKTTGNGKIGLAFFMTLFFGLIHGFGFSNYFRQIIAAEETKFIPSLEFALGIEAAQLIAVVLVLLLGFVMQTIFRFSKKEWMLIGAGIVIGFVIPMLINTWPF